MALWSVVTWVTVGMAPVAVADPAHGSVENANSVERANSVESASSAKNVNSAKNVKNVEIVVGTERPGQVTHEIPVGLGQDRILRRGDTPKAARARALRSGQDRDEHPRSGTLVRRLPWYRSAVASLVIVLLLLGGIYWAVRRWVPVARAPDNRVIQVVARTAIGPKQGLALVRLGRRFVLVGTSPDRMEALADISDPEEVADLLIQLGGAGRQRTGQFDKLLHGHGSALGKNDIAAGGEPSPLRTVSGERTEDTDDERVSGAMAALRDRLRTFGTQV